MRKSRSFTIFCILTTSGTYVALCRIYWLQFCRRWCQLAVLQSACMIAALQSPADSHGCGYMQQQIVYKSCWQGCIMHCPVPCLERSIGSALYYITLQRSELRSLLVIDVYMYHCMPPHNIHYSGV